MKIDVTEVDKAVTKIKKQINLECNTLPLIDEDLLRVRREQEQELNDANERLTLEVREEILKTDLQMDTQLREIAGVYKDEVTLLSRVCQYCYQCLAEFDFVEQELVENSRMRFYGTVKFNGYIVGKGYGGNKK